MGRNVNRWLCRGALLAAAVTASPLAAQSAQPPNPTSRTLADVAASDAVMSRSRPDYDAAGIDAGGFRLFPTLQLNAVYDDNIYNIDSDRVGDGSGQIMPRIVAQSQWSRHSLVFTGGGDFERFFDRTTENSDQYNVAADGRLDVTRDIAISAGGGYAREVEPRGTLGDIFSVGERNRYDLGTAHLSATAGFARLLITVGGNFSAFNYLPVRVDGVEQSQDYRDREESMGTLRADYVLTPGLRTFVSGSYSNVSYDHPPAGFNQDSHGYTILGGIAFGVNELISGQIGIGYLKQFYDQADLTNIGGFSYNASVIWNPTTLLTVTGTAARSIQQSPYIGQTGILQDSVGLTADYELLRNVILTANGQFVSDSYRGLDRTDRLWVIEGRVRYLMNRWMETGLVLNHRFQNTSSILGREYAGSSATLSVTFKR